MALSRLASEFAAEINNHDWSDAPYRRDRAGHNRSRDPKAPPEPLSARQTDYVQTNVMWVVAQVLGYEDPNFDPCEFAEACGVDMVSNHSLSKASILAGLRIDNGRYATPGTWDHMPG
ncbi:hypothetical protein ADK57_25615 [Streptomyces sp. MMG1533]|uniref:hypothetical protein n=1 Tax=Streptomyces sp. MMG1533 TaxID=1415546 RepID=UPI0006B01ED1|nr:hypothetical protein [Streptomyces sp. MMG1533]KOU62026.1 hypothetical protein ADK57_25615 [Streptomyces sp. MMG1533]